MTSPALTADFFNRDTLTVAKELLGHHLVTRNHDGVEHVYRIVETEAYTGEDPACHAYEKRRTGRAANLYNPPGLAYVYLIYGMYHCLNVITEPEGVAGAVLFRALEPLGVAKESIVDASQKTHGPGRLTRALGITKDRHNAMNLTDTSNILYLAHGQAIDPSDIIQTTRIGISKATDYPWRFYVDSSPWVSVRTPRPKKTKAP